MNKINENAFKYVKNIGYLTILLILSIAGFTTYQLFQTGSSIIARIQGLSFGENIITVAKYLELSQTTWFIQIKTAIETNKIYYEGGVLILLSLFILIVFLMQVFATSKFAGQHKNNKKTLFSLLWGVTFLAISAYFVSLQTSSYAWIKVLAGAGPLYNILNIFLLLLILAQIVIVITKIVLMVKNNEFKLNFFIIDFSRYIASIAALISGAMIGVYLLVFNLIAGRVDNFAFFRTNNVTEYVINWLAGLVNLPTKITDLGQDIPFVISDVYLDNYVIDFVNTYVWNLYDRLTGPLVFIFIISITLMIMIRILKRQDKDTIFAIYFIIAITLGINLLFFHSMAYWNALGYILIIMALIHLYEAARKYKWVSKIKKLMKK